MATQLKIGALAKRTGVPTASLRAWERRYGLLDPERSAGGQRLYSEDDVAVLVAIRRMLEDGWRIGDVAALGRDKILELGREAVARDADRPRTVQWHEGELEADLPRLVLEAAPCGVVVTDVEGRTRWINPGFGELCGYGLSELFGRTPGSVLQGEGTDPETVARMRGSVRERRTFSGTVLNYHRAGHLYVADVSIAPLGVGHDHRGFVGIARAVDPPAADHRDEGASEDVGQAVRSLAAAAAKDPSASGLYLSIASALTSAGE